MILIFPTISSKVYALTGRVDKLERLIVAAEAQHLLPSHCSPSLCHGHGECHIAQHGFTCTCTHSYVGEFCQYEVCSNKF